MARSKYVLTAALMIVGALALGNVAVAQSPPDVGSEVRFFNWDDFVDPMTIQGFEEEFEIKVIVETFGDENEAVSVIQGDASRFDLFVISASVIREMAEQRLLASLDHANIPNLVNVDPLYLDLSFDRGNEFSVPYTWGTTGIAYNTDCVTPEKESWGLLMDPSVAGRIAMDSDFRVVIASMLKYNGHPLNSGDPVQLADAIDSLSYLAENQGLEFHDWNETLDGLASGDLCVGQSFNGDAAAYMDSFDNLGFFVPDEGSDFYVDSLAIPRDANNKAGAELFINYILRPSVHAANNEYTGYAVPNRASIEGGFVSDEALANRVRYPDRKGLEPWLAFDLRLRTVWNEAWSAFVIDHT